MNRNSQIAAAVAAVLASASATVAFAAPPTLTQAQSPYATLYIAGSSAAKNAILNALEVDLCGGSTNALVFSSTGDTNFFAVSCAPATATGVTGANGTNVFTVYYRDEGGSVVGALPIVSGASISQLSLAGATCTGSVCAVPVGGTTANNGIDDSFTGVVKAPVQLGITDVEPTAFVGDNYPTAYKTSVYGVATAGGLAGLTATPIFQQVFGIFVNSTSLNTPISLSREEVAALLNGGITDWSKVEDTVTHAKVASASVPVHIVNREAGSGSRTATSIYFEDDECNPNNTGVSDAGALLDYFSTGNVLAAASTTTGGITYASIDNAPPTGMVLASLNSVAPSNLAAAQGLYDYWYEATAVQTNATLTATQSSLVTYLIAEFQTLNTAPHSAQVLAIPGIGTTTNTSAIPVSGTANRGTSGTATTIYVNPFTRIGVSCNEPISSL
jgi:hypothetical protein